MIGGRIVHLQVRIEAEPAVVFSFLTEADRYARWQGVKAELDARPGGIFKVWMDTDTVAIGEYVEVLPPHRVVFTWGWEGNDEVPPGSTRVEIDLLVDAAGTLLTLRHSGLPTLRAASLHEEGWALFVSRLNVAAGGGDPGPMPQLPPASAD